MTRIGSNSADPAGTGAYAAPGQDEAARHRHSAGEEEMGRHAGDRRDALGGGMRDALRDGGRHPGSHAREAHSRGAFEQSLRRALGDADAPATARPAGQADPPADGGSASWAVRGEPRHHTLREQGAEEEDGAGDAGPGTERLLALAERPPGFALVPAAAAPAPPAGAEQAARVEALTLRVEEAVRAELYAAPGRPVTLRLDLGGLVPGLLGLTVAMTPDGIDVTLARAAGPPSAELMQAAQALAERLQTRFARRIVRVLDAPVPATPADGPRRTAADGGDLPAGEPS